MANEIGFACALVYVAVMFADSILFIRGDDRAPLIASIGYMFGGCWLAYEAVTPITPLGTPTCAFISIIQFIAANIFWDRWNKRRRKKPKKARGKVRVRLGRLVVVPA